LYFKCVSPNNNHYKNEIIGQKVKGRDKLETGKKGETQIPQRNNAYDVIAALKYKPEFRAKFIKDPIGTIDELYPLTAAQKEELRKLDFSKMATGISVAGDCNNNCDYMAG
jgi:hypothetical protein